MQRIHFFIMFLELKNYLYLSQFNSQSSGEFPSYSIMKIIQNQKVIFEVATMWVFYIGEVFDENDISEMNRNTLEYLVQLKKKLFDENLPRGNQREG